MSALNIAGGSSGGGSGSNTSRVKISKSLSYLLRHGAQSSGLQMDTHGWVALSSLLKRPQLKNVTVSRIKEVVSECSKQRFSLKEEDGTLYIRANQGHTIANVEPDLELLTASTLPKTVVHGTYLIYWESIKKKGLNRMERNHIHFAVGLPGSKGVISGMRKTCEVYIYVDAARATEDGISFWKSINGVILCAGNEEGYLPLKYFHKVVDVTKGFDNSTFEEIVDFYFDYGVIDAEVFNLHAFLLFNTKDDIDRALKATFKTKRGRKAVAMRRAYRVHTDDVVIEEEKFEFGVNAEMRLRELSSTSEQLEDSISLLIQDVQMKKFEIDQRQKIIYLLEKSLCRMFSSPKCYLFGSSVNGLGFRGADADVLADLGYDPYECADGEARAAELTRALAKNLRTERLISNVTPIPSARVPIVKCVIEGVQVDLSFRNQMPMYNSQLIKLFTDCHPLVKRYMIIIRLWAKVHCVAGGGRPATFITNYALCMMMAFVVMRNKCLIPTVSALRRSYYDRVVVNGWNCGFSRDIHSYINKHHKLNTLDVVLEFFEFYANFDASQNVLCPLFGEIMTKSDMKAKRSDVLPPILSDFISAPSNLLTDTPLCVQDPLQLSHNVTKGLNQLSLSRFQSYCKNSAQLVREIINFSAPLSTLFKHDLNAMFEEEIVEEEKKVEEEEKKKVEEEKKKVEEEEKKLEEENEDDVVILNESMLTGVHSTENESKEVEVIDAEKCPVKRCNDQDVIILSGEGSEGRVSMTHRVLTNSDLNYFASVKPSFYHTISFNTRKLYTVNDASGKIEVKAGEHNVVSIRKQFIDILTYMFKEVFRSESIVCCSVSLESPAKKMKYSVPQDKNYSSSCFAHFACTKVTLLTKKRQQSKNKQAALYPKANAFLLEKKTSIAMGQRQLSYLDVNLFICHKKENLADFNILVNRSDEMCHDRVNDVNNFMSAFVEIVNGCLSTEN